MGKASIRSNYWATIVYPESAPEDWMEILEDFKIPAIISPLHDRDFDKDGVIKKSHYHVMLCFPSLKSQGQAERVFDAIKGVGAIEIMAVQGYARYLLHLDNP